MKKNIIYIISILLICSSCSKVEFDEKQSTAFFKLFGSNYIDAGFDIKQTPDEGYIITGEIEIEEVEKDIINHTNLLAIKTDKYGNYLWVKHFGDSLDDVGNCVQILQNGNYLFFGTTTIDTKNDNNEENDNKDLFIVILNEVGDTIRIDVLGNKFNEKGNYAVQADNGDFIFVGSMENRRFMMRIDSSLSDTIWHDTSITQNNSEYIDILKLNSDKYYFTYNKYNSSQKTSGYPLGSIMDGISGTIDYSTSYPVSSTSRICRSSVLLPDKSIVIVGQMDNDNTDIYLAKFNYPYEYTNIVWEKSISAYGNINSYDVGLDIKLTNDNNLVLVGYTNASKPDSALIQTEINDLENNYDSYIAKLDTGGNVLWDTTYGGLGDQIANAVIQSTDGRYVFVGSTEFVEGNNLIFMIKVNSEGILKFE